MQSKWRVACVRIPRFPIGAVWQHAIAAAKRSLPRTVANQAPAQRNEIAEQRSEQERDRCTLPRKRRFGEAYVRRDQFILEGRRTRGQGPGAPPENTTSHRVTPDDSPSHDSRVHQSDRVRHWDEIPIALSDGLRVRAVTAAERGRGSGPA